MRITTLHGKLSAVLLVIFVTFTVLTLALNLFTTRAFLDEVNQKVAVTLASHIVAEQPWMASPAIDEAAVKTFFTAVMTLNPLAEMYLLDGNGRIVASSVPTADIRRQTVDLAPLHRLLRDEPPPVFGDDPRDRNKQKVFSVAPLRSGSPGADASVPGYLYIVLGGAQFDSTVSMLLGSRILRGGVWSLVVSLAGAVIAGAFMVVWLTRPLRALTRAIEQLETDGFRSNEIHVGLRRRWPDEIDRLTMRYHTMATQLSQHLDTLERLDEQRRDMMANISHDLKTPLAAMQGYLDTLLVKGVALTEEDRHTFVALALGQGKRLDHLVSELLELARLEGAQPALTLEWSSLCDLVQDVVHKFSKAATDAQLALDTELDADVPLVMIDVRLFERLLDNLVVNAIKHTRPGGRILIRCKTDATGPYVTVEDSGPGIHVDDLPFVFDRFYRGRRTPEDSSGAGLGLAISRRIADLHHATLTVTSVEGRGTTFILHFAEVSTESARFT